MMKSKEIPFTKMQATGNDFILIDEFEKILIPGDKKPEFVSNISDRHFGVGSDGVIFVHKSRKYDIKFSFYNPDGSMAEMCGNGIRCFAKYVYEKGIAGKNNITWKNDIDGTADFRARGGGKIRVETLAGLIIPELVVKDGTVVQVKVDMGAPVLNAGEIPVSVPVPVQEDFFQAFINIDVRAGGALYRATAIGMGNPHAVIFPDCDLDEINIIETGRNIRYNAELFPNGVNVHFVQKTRGGSKNEFRIRTYERGVENETMACGTGVCASAVAAFLNGRSNSGKMIFHALGGDLSVELETAGSEIKRVYLIGPVEDVFIGNIKVR